MQIITSAPIQLDALGTKFEVPTGDFNKFSCEAIGDIGSGVLAISRKVTADSPVIYDFASPHIELDSNTTNHFALDVAGVGAVVFTVTTAASGKSITINTLAERF